MFTGISVRNIKRERKGAEWKMMPTYIWNIECWLGHALLDTYTCKWFYEKKYIRK